ncbi:hypothetical protein KH5H1_28820 [Corallococcus caeni]|nr:hypothetical protein KH5H1_28820 [Corallococcus sp. KH5-1]
MVRVGLVAYVEEQLEQDIALGRLPRNGRLASERVMARWYGVSRGTVREALRRLAARGLVVQHPGRQARAVALDESLTLENLGLALHAAHSEEGRRLLEGFFSLKRQVLVELLAECCARASESQVSQLEASCYALWDAARWHPGERCAQLEFELLRLAAQAAARPGHLLLIQSLQRAFRGIGARLLPFMGGEPLREWAICAMQALGERDMQALQHQLPVLLKTCDERVLDQFTTRPQEQVAPEAAPEALTSVETHEPDNPVSDAGQAAAFEGGSCIETADSSDPLFATEQDEGLEASSCVEERGIGIHLQANAAPVAAPCALVQAVSMEPDSEVPGFTAAPGPAPREPGGEGTGGIQLKAPPINSCGRPHGATCDADGLISGDTDPPVH